MIENGIIQLTDQQTIIAHNCSNLIIQMFYQSGDTKLWFLLRSHFICETLRTLLTHRLCSKTKRIHNKMIFTCITNTVTAHAVLFATTLLK